MPQIELIIPEKLLFIFSNFSFLSFSFFVAFILSRVFGKFLLFFILLPFILSFVYGDIFLKHILKIYYQNFMQDSKIYIKANKNSSGKIESLDLKDIYTYNLKFSTNFTIRELESIKSVHSTYIDKFVEISTISNRMNKNIYSSQKIALNENKLLLKEEARYSIKRVKKDSFFKNIYTNYEFKFIDNINKINIATAYNLYFETDTNKIRNRYLYWDEIREKEFSPKSISNFDNIYKKLFIDN